MQIHIYLESVMIIKLLNHFLLMKYQLKTTSALSLKFLKHCVLDSELTWATDMTICDPLDQWLKLSPCTKKVLHSGQLGPFCLELACSYACSIFFSQSRDILMNC